MNISLQSNTQRRLQLLNKIKVYLIETIGLGIREEANSGYTVYWHRLNKTNTVSVKAYVDEVKSTCVQLNIDVHELLQWC